MGVKKEREGWKERLMKQIQKREGGTGVPLTEEEYQEIMQLPDGEEGKAVFQKIWDSEKRKIN